MDIFNIDEMGNRILNYCTIYNEKRVPLWEGTEKVAFLRISFFIRSKKSRLQDSGGQSVFLQPF